VLPTTSANRIATSISFPMPYCPVSMRRGLYT
jgi:hypothetical protein